ncbi:MAG: BolA/IbaG family iron-sulfur metabolism protein [Candidatus Melainabacteria bacterium]|nr:BolA/IbaG family iron-sulfur metabolism protein [Candidatus Melainabacteria bacterium]
MLLEAQDIENILRDSLAIESVQAIDLKGGNHWQINIISSDFEGLSRVKREQLVQRSLKDLLANESIHALVVKANTKDEI